MKKRCNAEKSITAGDAVLGPETRQAKWINLAINLPRCDICSVVPARNPQSEFRHMEVNMRTLMFVRMPLEPFNTAVRNGSAGTTIKKILDDAKPEAVYFTETDGCRSGIVVIDIPKPSDLPRFSEPWFLHFNAEVKFRIAMTPEDLMQADLPGLGKKWG